MVVQYKTKKTHPGECVWMGCDKPSAPYEACMCQDHRILARERQRRLSGCEEWVPGGPGYPPIQDFTDEEVNQARQAALAKAKGKRGEK